MSRESSSAENYHLLLMIERMQRDGSSEAAIEKAVRIASECRPPRRGRADDGRSQ